MTALLFMPGPDPIIAGQPLSWWEANHELPLHIYHAGVIRRNLRAFKQVFEQRYPKGRICFAAKACPHGPILKIAREEGCGADVASYNEARCALEAGIPAELLDLNGSCKEDFLLRDAIRRGMNIIADCIEEVELLDAIARELGQPARVMLRISGYVLGQVTDDSIFTAGRWTKFGAPLDAVPEFIDTLSRYPWIRLVGFHTHIGSQITTLEPYRSVLAKLIEMGHRLNQSGGLCEVINIGGGFPVRYIDKSAWDVFRERIRQGYEAVRRGDHSQSYVWHDGAGGYASETGDAVNLDHWLGERFYTDLPKEAMLDALLQSDLPVAGSQVPAVHALRQLGKPLLAIEPGRSIMEDSGVTLARVGMVKTVARHHHLVNLEMGVTSHGESLIEKPIKRWTIATDSMRHAAEPFETFIGGNLCFSGDMLSKYKVSLQRKPRRGEVILIHDTGAYSSSLFAAASNAYPRPARILVHETGATEVMKRRDNYADIVG